MSVLKNQIDKAREAAEKSRRAVEKLIQRCTHQSVKSKYGAAICQTCGIDLGWYCSASPSSACVYNKSGSSCCDYCGEPSDRQ